MDLKHPQLSFDETTHIYRLDGVEIPSVSKLMEPLSQHEYGAINPAVLEAAAHRGTAVHNAIENYMKFGLLDISEDYQGYIDGFLAWWDLHHPEVIGSEVRTYHPLMRYGGTVDLIAKIDGDITLIDFKTTSRLVTKNCRVQLEAYSQALRVHGIDIQKKRILHLEKDGKWSEPEFQVKDIEAWKVFGALKCVYDYLQKEG